MRLPDTPIRRLLHGLLWGLVLCGPTQPHDGDRSDSAERADRVERSERDNDRDRDRDAERGADHDRSGRRERDEDRSGPSANSGSGRDSRRDGGRARRDEERREQGRGSSSGGRRPVVDVERNERGGDRQRSEVLLIGPETLGGAVRGAGYEVLSEQRLESLRQNLLRIRVRDSETVEQAVDRLKQQVPEVRAAPNHIFRPMGISPAPLTGNTAAPSGARPAASALAARIGVIDTGADVALPTLRAAVQASRGFAPGGYTPRAHGSAVAQLAAAQGARLLVADVFGVDAKQRLVAPADAIVGAIDWLLGEKLRVINISIEGPRNEVLEFVIGEAVARDVAIVAAVGNDGPNAPPGYPAAWPGVIGVTALDERGIIYRRAARGPQVQFAARGSHGGPGSPVVSAERLSGTSFASPVVAAALEKRWRETPQATREQVVAALRASAVDRGDKGWDPVYGWGEIAAEPAAAR